MGIPIETRRLITERVIEGKISLKIDISGLDLPYIPKQVRERGGCDVGGRVTRPARCWTACMWSI